MGKLEVVDKREVYHLLASRLQALRLIWKVPFDGAMPISGGGVNSIAVTGPQAMLEIVDPCLSISGHSTTCYRHCLCAELLVIAMATAARGSG